MTASSVQLRSNHVKSSHDRDHRHWRLQLAQAALFILLGLARFVCCIGT